MIVNNSHFQPVSQRFASLAGDNPTAQVEAFGKLVRVAGGRLEVSGLKAGIGSRCSIDREGHTPHCCVTFVQLSEVARYQTN